MIWQCFGSGLDRVADVLRPTPAVELLSIGLLLTFLLAAILLCALRCLLRLIRRAMVCCDRRTTCSCVISKRCKINHCICHWSLLFLRNKSVPLRLLTSAKYCFFGLSEDRFNSVLFAIPVNGCNAAWLHRVCILWLKVFAILSKILKCHHIARVRTKQRQALDSRQLQRRFPESELPRLKIQQRFSARDRHRRVLHKQPQCVLIFFFFESTEDAQTPREQAPMLIDLQSVRRCCHVRRYKCPQQRRRNHMLQWLVFQILRRLFCLSQAVLIQRHVQP